MDLQQGNKTVKEFESEFNRLAPYAAELVSDEESKATCFIEGLNPHLRRITMASRCSTYGDAVEMARAFEKDFLKSRNDREAGEKKKKRKENFENQSLGNGKKPTISVPQGHSVTPFPKCNKCGGNHRPDQCNVQERVCFRCKQPGHFKVNCPLNTPQTQVGSNNFRGGSYQPQDSNRNFNHNNRNNNNNKGNDSRGEPARINAVTHTDTIRNPELMTEIGDFGI